VPWKLRGKLGRLPFELYEFCPVSVFRCRALDAFARVDFSPLKENKKKKSLTKIVEICAKNPKGSINNQGKSLPDVTVK